MTNGNPTSHTKLKPDQIDRAIDVMKEWVANPASRPDREILFAGVDEALSLEKILEITEARQDAGEWGQGDIVEMIIEKIAQSQT